MKARIKRSLRLQKAEELWLEGTSVNDRRKVTARAKAKAKYRGSSLRSE
jgi:hypothetical protein